MKCAAPKLLDVSQNTSKDSQDNGLKQNATDVILQ